MPSALHTMTSSCMQGLPFHTPCLQHFDWRCDKIVESGAAGGKRSESLCLYTVHTFLSIHLTHRCSSGYIWNPTVSSPDPLSQLIDIFIQNLKRGSKSEAGHEPHIVLQLTFAIPAMAMTAF